MTIKFILSVTLLTIASCKKSDVGIEQEIKIQDLPGKWTWFKSSGGIAGKTITPASTGNNNMLDISGSKMVKRYRNGTLLSQEQYVVQKGTSIFSNDKLYYQLVPVNGGFKQSIIRLSNDTLVLADEVYDGYTSGYVRQK